MKRAFLTTVVVLLAACGDGSTSNNATTNNATTNNTTANNTTANNTTANNTTANNTPDPTVVLLNPDDCYAFSDDPDVPLALDGWFDADSPVWRRPHSDEAVCPAQELLPDTAALVPYLAVKFCNPDIADHTYDIEFVGQDGPNGEPPLADAYLVLYEGENLPRDHRQCLAANDDIEGAIDSGDSEILGVTVPSGGAVTVVATTFTFDPNDGTGTGGYILVVTNAD